MERTCAGLLASSRLWQNNTKPGVGPLMQFACCSVLIKQACKAVMHESSCTQMTVVSSALHGWQHVIEVGVISCVSGA